uniref:START domain-containing protein n=1 Tax=Panagrolaimus superbus TaxID=310955 RepID=A0A914YJL4_9BILA
MSAVIPSEVQEGQVDGKNDQFDETIKIANEVFDEAFALYNESGFEGYDGWKKETETDTSIVHIRQMPYGKLFALRATIPWNFEKVFHEQWHGLDTVATWNENIVFQVLLKRLMKILMLFM